MNPASTEQCIVLPLRPVNPQLFDGTGLALHFLIGNVLVLHTGLKEMWFGWRVKKIFPQQETLQRYCRDAASRLDLIQVSRSQKVRFWLFGTYENHTASLHLFDAKALPRPFSSIDLPISIDDGLIEFRRRFIQWLDALGHPMPKQQISGALWPEAIQRKGLDAVGRALEAFYIYSAYTGDAPLDLTLFRRAADETPESFMAQDLHGWALYRSRDYKAAKIAFLKSLRINPSAAGAMSGLMWCGVYAKDLEEAMFWSGRKADLCGKDVQAARESARRRYEKVHP
jgi:tetratricopeptide (TPR) repeat protein